MRSTAAVMALATPGVVKVPRLIFVQPVNPERSVDDMIDALKTEKKLPPQDADRCRKVLGELTATQRDVVCCVLLESEAITNVACRFLVDVADIKIAISTALDVLCKNGRGVTTLCALVRQGRIQGY